MITLSSHVLDTTLGKPAEGIRITITHPDGHAVTGVTDSDGRCKAWGDKAFESGQYQVRFHTQDYLQAQHKSAFYPFVDVHVQLEQDGGHYHIPLLISPYGFSSYRGS